MLGLFRLTRRLFLLLIVVLVAASGACVARAGRFLVDPHAMDTPRAADAIVVLSGSPADRWLEAYDLWREQRAPRIVLSPGYRDGASRALAARGVRVPSDVDVARAVMERQLGVPAAAVIEMDGPQDNTAAEAAATRRLAERHGWRSVIVVTSVAHTRRTGLAMRRVLEPAGVAVQIRGSRYDAYRADRWWQSRASARWVLAEMPKLVAYRLGLGE